MNSRNERRRMYAGDGKTSVITKSHRTTACSAESLGARSVPSLDRSSSPECEPNCERVGTDSSMAATLTDEPLFESRGRKFEHTLAIIKPEAARLMYKVEAIFARKGFIVIAVRTRFALITTLQRVDVFFFFFNKRVRFEPKS